MQSIQKRQKIKKGGFAKYIGILKYTLFYNYEYILKNVIHIDHLKINKMKNGNIPITEDDADDKKIL